MPQISFTVHCTPIPQGSMKGFVMPAKGDRKARAVLTSDNSKLKPYRKQVARCAMMAMRDNALGEIKKHTPVSINVDFTFERPASVSKKRLYPVVKPDIDKLERAILDSLTGVVYFDDAQVCQVTKTKNYGPVPMVHISVTVMEEKEASRLF